MQDQTPAQNEFKEYGLNFGQIVLLFALLLIPQIIGNVVITSLGLTEVKHYLDIFMPLAAFTVIYYVGMLALHNRLTNRIYEMIYVKYLIVIGLVFWTMADGYLAYIFQDAYIRNNNINIIPRDIVWRDVPFEELPDYVVYPDFKWAFMFVLCTARAVVVAVLTYSLMAERKKPGLQRKVSKRRDFREKDLDDIKASVHPSVLKRYQNDNSEKQD